VSSSVGFVHHESSLQHENHPGHPEDASRVRAIVEHLRSTQLMDRLDIHEPETADRELIELAHERALVELLEELDKQGGGRIDLDTSMGPGSLEATLRASQGAVDAVSKVLDGTWSSAFVCMRPPGHHARPRIPMGFCLTNHVAVAARWAIAERGLERVAVVDWDAHHGNGTQEIFWSDPSVLYVSLHQYPWYPGSGDASERGDGAGLGYTLNVPLPAGTAEDVYERAFEELIEPAVDDFDPQLVIVSAGYDAHAADPLCMMRLQAGAFHRFAQRLKGWGKPGPVCVLEGGYDLDALGWSAGATIEALLGAGEPSHVPEAELDRAASPPESLRSLERAAALSRRRG
jgi:acetoin utilization deacetylase AcuC-like enzyme